MAYVKKLIQLNFLFLFWAGRKTYWREESNAFWNEIFMKLRSSGLLTGVNSEFTFSHLNLYRLKICVFSIHFQAQIAYFFSFSSSSNCLFSGIILLFSALMHNLRPYWPFLQLSPKTTPLVLWSLVLGEIAPSYTRKMREGLWISAKTCSVPPYNQTLACNLSIS